MQQKTRKQKPPAGVIPPPVKGSARKPDRAPGARRWPGYVMALVVAGILLATFAAFYPALDNTLLKTWDDQVYISDNPLVKSLAPDSIVKIFREDRGKYANYHPLTTLSLAVNYHFSKEDPFSYHLVNIILHLLNTLLVFVFVYLLSGKKGGMAAVAALLFGLCPIHVESVAWLSERKDVLYAFFFLASLITYQQFLARKNWVFYAISLLLFLCSMLSKAMAASLPLALVLVEFMEKKRWSWKMIPDKIPYLAIAVFLGLYAIRIQAEGNAIGRITFPTGMLMLHAAYGYPLYILKTLVSIGLSAFYPYPYPLVNSMWITNEIPSVFYLTLLVSVALLGFSVFSILSGKRDLRVTGFGLLFYAATIALVLQFIPVGRAIMADRYAYIPSVGLFFILGYFAWRLFQMKTWKVPAVAAIVVYAGFFFYQTRQQVRVWHDDGSLWSNVIANYPQDNRVVLAYSNRAQYLQEKEKPREALEDLLLVARWNPKDDNVLDRIGKIYGKELQDLETAVKYFEAAHRLNPKNLDAIIDLATAYGMRGEYSKSLEYSLKGLEIDTNDAFLLFNAGITYTNLGQKALGQQYMDRAVKIDPTLKRN